MQTKSNPELKILIETIKETLKETKLKVSDDTILIEACKFMRTPKTNYSPKETKELKKATPKQIDFLCKNNIDHDSETLTKKEAFKLIKSYLDNKK